MNQDSLSSWTEDDGRPCFGVNLAPQTHAGDEEVRRAVEGWLALGRSVNTILSLAS